MRKIGLFMLLGYKRLLSPIMGRDCKFTPTCSMYTYDAVKSWGLLTGSLLGLLRVLRCNRFSKGGFDPIRENYKGKIRWLI